MPTADVRRNLLAAQSSTGSESAYETIRERHQNIGEALASSFEFYSTSPRDARVLGYVTSDPENQKQADIQDGSKINEAKLHPHISDVAGISMSSNKSTDQDIYSSTDSYKQQHYVPRISPKKAFRKTRLTKKSKARSSNADSEEVSSNVSVVQIQRQRYIRRFKNYIHTLKKLERSLMPPSLKSSLEPKRLMVEANDTSSEESRVCFQNDAALSNMASSLQISSEDPSSTNTYSYDGVGNSLIIHRTCSETLMNNSDSSSLGKLKVNAANSFVSSNLPSLESRSHRTPTLCHKKGLINKPTSTNHSYNVESNLKSCGEISDFRKLMSSTAAPGEMRPYRYLLQKENFNDSDVRQNKISENNSIPNKIEHARKNIDLRNSDYALEDAPVIEDDPLSNRCTSTYDTFEESMLGEKSMVEKNQTKMRETDEAGTQMVNASTNCQLTVISRETRDFCQMYPSSSYLQAHLEANEIPKISQAVGTQTDESEVHTYIVDEPVVLLSKSLTNDHNLSGIGRESSVSQDRCHISLLDQMEAKIKNNTYKINLALEDYNKQFGPLTSEEVPNKVIEPKAKSLPKQQNAAKLNFQNEFSELGNHHFQSSKNAEMSVCGNIIDTRIDKPLESFATAKNGLKFTVNVDSKLGSKESLNKSLAEELIELNKEKEIMTLQEALALARPSYIKDAEKRRIKICRKQTLRRELQEHNQSVLAQLPDNLKTPTVLRKFLYQPDESPLFNYKAMREQNKRLYQMLPEAQKPAILQKNESKSKVRRLMASYYSRKLRGKVLSGKVSHAHRHIVTPIR